MHEGRLADSMLHTTLLLVRSQVKNVNRLHTLVEGVGGGDRFIGPDRN
jgi:hypothetical protein